MVKKDGLYRYPVWIKRRVRGERKKGVEAGDAMDVGGVENNKFDPMHLF